MPHADLLITNARVFTADPAQPAAGAVATVGARLAFVGSTAEAAAWRGPRTRVIDAAGCSLLPGLIDSHFHLLPGSLGLGDAGLREVDSLESLSATLGEFAAANPGREWLAGYGLRYGLLPGGGELTRQHLDALPLPPDRPLIVFAYDLHTAWANTEALRRAGVLHGAETGPNSEIVLGQDGLASGELRESGAFSRLTALIPPPDAARKRALLHKGLAEAAALGITSLHNMDGDAEQLALYAALEDAGELTLRVYCPYRVEPETPPEALAEAAAWREAYQTEFVRAGLVKFFMDGVIGRWSSFRPQGQTSDWSRYGCDAGRERLRAGRRGKSTRSSSHAKRSLGLASKKRPAAVVPSLRRVKKLCTVVRAASLRSLIRCKLLLQSSGDSLRSSGCAAF